MSQSTAASPATLSSAPPMGAKLGSQLSIMMFLQYAIWGAWLPLLWPFLSEHRKFSPDDIGWMFAVGAVGAIVAPFVAGQIADRYFSTERFLGLSHIVGGLLIWQLSAIETFQGFLWFSLAYSLVYSPTMPLTNSLAFHHMPDRDRDFGRVRVWGTIGWIAVGIGIVAMLVLLAVILSSKGGEQVGLADTGGSARPLNARGGDATTGSVIARAVTCVLLALSIPGFNETAMLATGLFLLIGGMATFRRNRAMCALFAVSLVALAVGGAVNVLAPGNYNRMADLPEAKNLGRSLSRGIGMTFAFFFRWLANPAAIGVTLLVLPGIAARVKDVTLPWPRRRVLTVIVLATIALFFSVLFLGYWAKGQNAPRRVQNVLYFVQLLSWFAFVIMAVAGRPAIAWPAWMSAHRVKVGVLLLAIGVFGVSRWPAAMMDLWHLRGHLDEIAERDRLIAQQMNAEQFDLVIPADSRELRTLCYPAMKVDDPAWVMESYAQWLGARSVKVVPRAEAPQ